MTGFESWMVKATRFWSWIAKIKLGQELDGQKWTLSKKIQRNNSCYSLCLLLNIIFYFRATNLTRFIENTCNIYISK